MDTYGTFFAKDCEKYDRQGFIAWLKEEERSENTIATYVKAVDIFFEQESDFTKASVLRFKQRLIEQVSPKTVNNRICGICAYADWIGMPLKIKPLKIQKKTFVENVISQEQYEQLLAGLKQDKNEKWYILIKFLACTGARVSELIQFKKKHLISGEMELYTKGKIRTIYIPESLICECKEYFESLNPEDYLFISKIGTQMTTRGISEMLLKFSDRYNIPRNVCHPHSFRHRFAINFLKNNNDISLLADLLGHSGVNTTMIYLRKSKEEQRAAINGAVNW